MPFHAPPVAASTDGLVLGAWAGCFIPIVAANVRRRSLAKSCSVGLLTSAATLGGNCILGMKSPGYNRRVTGACSQNRAGRGARFPFQFALANYETDTDPFHYQHMPQP